MSLYIIYQIYHDIEKLCRQIDLWNFQSTIPKEPLKIQACGWQQLEMISQGITCHICDDFEKLGQGQIKLQNFQLVISQ